MVLLVVALLVFAACSSDSDDRVLGNQVTSPVPSETSEPSPRPSKPRLIEFPSPDRNVPTRPGSLARHLIENERKLKRAIDMWLDLGGERLSRAGRRVALGALWQQKMFRVVTKKPALARKVIARVPNWLGRKLRVHAEAGAGLRSLAAAVDPPVDFRITPPDNHAKLQRYYRKAGRRYDIPVEILASLNFVESKFGRFMGPSSAGAKGPMQFIPSTWDYYGEGNIWNPHDAIMAAARYLSASGAPERMYQALLRYNNSSAYADAVLIYADEMRRRSHSYRAYYFWQVFVRTTEGDLQLTGPGRDV